jgi:hypothetical protein
LLYVVAPAMAVAAGVFVATAAGRGSAATAATAAAALTPSCCPCHLCHHAVAATTMAVLPPRPRCCQAADAAANLPADAKLLPLSCCCCRCHCSSHAAAKLLPLLPSCPPRPSCRRCCHRCRKLPLPSCRHRCQAARHCRTAAATAVLPLPRPHCRQAVAPAAKLPATAAKLLAMAKLPLRGTAACWGLYSLRNGVLAVTGRNGVLAITGRNGVLAVTGRNCCIGRYWP